MSEKSIAWQMAEFAVGLKYEDLPENVIYEVKRYLYDSIGCAYGSMSTHDVKSVLEVYQDMGGKPESKVILMIFTGKTIRAIPVTLYRLLYLPQKKWMHL